MITLCVLSKQNSDALLQTLLCVFREKKVLLCREGSCDPELSEIRQTEVLILENPACGEIRKPCLFLLRQYEGVIPASRDSVAVVDSADSSSLEILQRAGIRTVTCGFLSTDVFALSSVGEDSLTVSLQRSIPSLFDGSLEPRDVVFRCDIARKKQQSALLAVSAGILCEEL